MHASHDIQEADFIHGCLTKTNGLICLINNYIYIYIIKGNNFKYINFGEMGKSLIKKKKTLKVQIIL
jgi:hypothetical protein